MPKYISFSLEESLVTQLLKLNAEAEYLTGISFVMAALKVQILDLF